MENKRNTEQAFKWIVGILQKYSIPFQITGGFAARVYGSNRPLYDIDIDIPENMIKQIMPDVKDYIIWGPDRYLDDYFDLFQMTLNFEGQEIDISGDDIKIRKDKDNEWQNLKTNFSKSSTQEIYGIKVPVIIKEDLINYKMILGRDTDLLDIELVSKYKL